jgi:hypothetical protein
MWCSVAWFKKLFRAVGVALSAFLIDKHPEKDESHAETRYKV